MKSSLAPLKHVIDRWTRQGTTFVYINKKKECKSDHGTWGPQKDCFQAYIIHYHGPTDFAMGEAKEVLSLQMSEDHGRELPFYFCPNVSIVQGKKGRRRGKAKYKENS